jgi:hypothetical protein
LIYGIEIAALRSKEPLGPRSGLLAKTVIVGEVIVKTFPVSDFLKRIFGWAGRSSSDERGPEPGDGAVIHHSSGEADFDGLPGNVPPPTKDPERDLPHPPKRSAD